MNLTDKEVKRLHSAMQNGSPSRERKSDSNAMQDESRYTDVKSTSSSSSNSNLRSPEGEPPLKKRVDEPELVDIRRRRRMLEEEYTNTLKTLEAAARSLDSQASKKKESKMTDDKDTKWDPALLTSVHHAYRAQMQPKIHRLAAEHAQIASKNARNRVLRPKIICVHHWDDHLAGLGTLDEEMNLAIGQYLREVKQSTGVSLYEEYGDISYSFDTLAKVIRDLYPSKAWLNWGDVNRTMNDVRDFCLDYVLQPNKLREKGYLGFMFEIAPKMATEVDGPVAMQRLRNELHDPLHFKTLVIDRASNDQAYQYWLQLVAHPVDFKLFEYKNRAYFGHIHRVYNKYRRLIQLPEPYVPTLRIPPGARSGRNAQDVHGDDANFAYPSLFALDVAAVKSAHTLKERKQLVDGFVHKYDEIRNALSDRDHMSDAETKKFAEVMQKALGRDAPMFKRTEDIIHGRNVGEVVDLTGEYNNRDSVEREAFWHAMLGVVKGNTAWDTRTWFVATEFVNDFNIPYLKTMYQIFCHESQFRDRPWIETDAPHDPAKNRPWDMFSDKEKNEANRSTRTWAQMAMYDKRLKPLLPDFFVENMYLDAGISLSQYKILRTAQILQLPLAKTLDFETEGTVNNTGLKIRALGYLIHLPVADALQRIRDELPFLDDLKLPLFQKALELLHLTGAELLDYTNLHLYTSNDPLRVRGFGPQGVFNIVPQLVYMHPLVAFKGINITAGSQVRSDKGFLLGLQNQMGPTPKTSFKRNILNFISGRYADNPMMQQFACRYCGGDEA